jgi:hypothetical protein
MQLRQQSCSEPIVTLNVNRLTACTCIHGRCLVYVQVKPALGLLWSSCVNTRVMLHRSTAAARPVLSVLNGPGPAAHAAAGAAAAASTAKYGGESVCSSSGSGSSSSNSSSSTTIVESATAGASRNRRYLRLVLSASAPTNVVVEYSIIAAGVVGVN